MTPQSLTSYDIRFENRSDYLYVYLRGGETDVASSMRYWSEIIRRNSSNCVLIEKNVSESLDTGETFDVLSSVAFVANPSVRFAIFDHHYESQRHQYEEVVATNRGLNIKIFDEMAKAKKWLLGH